MTYLAVEAQVTNTATIRKKVILKAPTVLMWQCQQFSTESRRKRIIATIKHQSSFHIYVVLGETLGKTQFTLTLISKQAQATIKTKVQVCKFASYK